MAAEAPARAYPERSGPDAYSWGVQSGQDSVESTVPESEEVRRWADKQKPMFAFSVEKDFFEII